MDSFSITFKRAQKGAGVRSDDEAPLAKKRPPGEQILEDQAQPEGAPRREYDVEDPEAKIMRAGKTSTSKYVTVQNRPGAPKNESLVASRDIEPNTILFKYNANRVIKGEDARNFWKENFHTKYLYYGLNNIDTAAKPGYLGSRMLVIYGSYDEANASFNIVKGTEKKQERVNVVAKTAIKEGEDIVAYGGKTLLHRLNNKEWDKHYVELTENYYPGDHRPGVERTIYCDDKNCADTEKVCNCAGGEELYHCVPALCKCDPNLCQNRPTEAIMPNTYTTIQDSIEGTGLFAGEDMKGGQWVIEYLGEVIGTEEFDERSRFYKDMNYAVIMNSLGKVLDATRMGNKARCANHSCDPNCESMEAFDADGFVRVFLRVIPGKTIKKGEEITWFYDEVVDYDYELIDCKCGVGEKCRKTMNRKKTDEEQANVVQKESLADKARFKTTAEYVYKRLCERNLQEDLKDKDGLTDYLLTIGAVSKLDCGGNVGAKMRWLIEPSADHRIDRQIRLEQIRELERQMKGDDGEYLGTEDEDDPEQNPEHSDVLRRKRAARLIATPKKRRVVSKQPEEAKKPERAAVEPNRLEEKEEHPKKKAEKKLDDNESKSEPEPKRTDPSAARKATETTADKPPQPPEKPKHSDKTEFLRLNPAIIRKKPNPVEGPEKKEEGPDIQDKEKRRTHNPAEGAETRRSISREKEKRARNMSREPKKPTRARSEGRVRSPRRRPKERAHSSSGNSKLKPLAALGIATAAQRQMVPIKTTTKRKIDTIKTVLNKAELERERSKKISKEKKEERVKKTAAKVRSEDPKKIVLQPKKTTTVQQAPIQQQHNQPALQAPPQSVQQPTQHPPKPPQPPSAAQVPPTPPRSFQNALPPLANIQADCPPQTEPKPPSVALAPQLSYEFPPKGPPQPNVPPPYDYEENNEVISRGKRSHDASRSTAPASKIDRPSLKDVYVPVRRSEMSNKGKWTSTRMHSTSRSEEEVEDSSEGDDYHLPRGTPKASEPTRGPLVPSQPIDKLHQVGAEGIVMFPDIPLPEASAQIVDQVTRQMFQAEKPPATSSLDHYLNMAEGINRLSNAYQTQAVAQKTLMEPSNQRLKIHSESLDASARLTLEREKIASDQSIRNLEHIEKMAKMDTDRLTLKHKYEGYKEQLAKIKMETDAKLLEIEQQRARTEYGRKYVFGLSKEEGTTLVVSNEPCDLIKRKEFDRIWAETLSGQPVEDLVAGAKRLSALNVVSNVVPFKRYISSLTNSASKGYNSVLTKRGATAELFGSRGAIRAFQTGPEYQYSFFEVALTNNQPHQRAFSQMYGNPRYAVHFGKDEKLYGADLWEPLMTTGLFTVGFPYLSPNDFTADQGVDVYGNVYEDIVLSRKKAFEAPMKRADGLSTPDVRSSWFSLPGDGGGGGSFREYRDLRERALESLRRYSGDAQKYVNEILRPFKNRPLGVFLGAAEYVKYHHGEPQEVERLASILHRNGMEANLEIASALYQAAFHDVPLAQFELDCLLYVFRTYPEYHSKKRIQDTVREAGLMQELFNDDEKLIEAAMDLYGSDALSAPWGDEVPLEAVTQILYRVADIYRTFDYFTLPILADRIRQAVEKAFEYLGLSVVRSPVCGFRSNTSVLLHKMDRFYEVFPRRIRAVLGPLKIILQEQNLNSYWNALKKTMSVLSYYPDEEEETDEEWEELGLPMAPQKLSPDSYAVRQTHQTLSDNSEAVYRLESSIADELYMAVNDLIDQVDAKETLPTAAQIARLNRIKYDLIRVETGRRDPLIEQIRLLQSKVRVPGLQTTLERAVDMKRDVLRRIKEYELLNTSLNEARRALAKNQIKKYGPSEQYLKKERENFLERVWRREQPLEDRHGRMIYYDEAQPAHQHQRCDESQEPMQRSDQWLLRDEELEEEVIVPTTTDSVKENDDSKTSTSMLKQMRGNIKDIFDNQNGWNPEELSFEGTESGPPIYYSPVSEEWRKNIITNLFHEEHIQYGRVSYAVRFDPMASSGQAQTIIPKPTKGDGNCLYRALSYIVFGIEDKYAKIKNLLSTFAMDNTDVISDALYGERVNPIDILEEGVYGTSDVAAIASMFFNTKIYMRGATFGGVWMPVMDYSSEYNSVRGGVKWLADEAIYINHINWNHFEPAHKGVVVDAELDAIATGKPEPMYPFAVPSLAPGRVVRMDREFISNVLYQIFKARNGLTLTYNTLNSKSVKDYQRRRNLSGDSLPLYKQQFFNEYYKKVFRISDHTEYVSYQLLKTSTGAPDWGSMEDIRVQLKKHAKVILSDPIARKNRVQDDAGPYDLVVDFANANIGGGAHKDGSAQEEALFLQCVEAYAAIFLMREPMKKNEAVLMKNLGVYSDYVVVGSKTGSGELDIVRFDKNQPLRTINVVGIDATDYRNKPSWPTEIDINRDLKKVYTGFNVDWASCVRTGNLGGGVFKGNIKINFIIQLMVSVLLDKRMVYCAYSKKDLDAVTPVLKYCEGKSLSKLYADITINQSKIEAL